MEIKSMSEFKQLLEFYECLGTGCEVGVAEGRTSYDFLSYGIEKLYMVDAWQTLEQTGDGGFPQEWHEKNLADAKERVKQFGDKAIFLRGKSIEMSDKVEDGSLDFIYIDANHSYEGCISDLTAWVPKVKQNGIISGHDYNNSSYGVTEAVNNYCHINNYSPIHTIEEGENNTSFWFIKKSIKNAYTF